VESLLLDHARMYQTRSLILRPFSVYGPGLRKQLLWDAMEKASRGQFEFFGTGRELRDWVYVSDLIECLSQIGRYATAEVPVFNAGTCRAVSVRDVLLELFNVAGFEKEPIFLGKHKEGDPDCLVADDSAESLLGPLFQTPLRAGLAEYVRWYRQRGSHD
jgi:UDP-glucose 4-epimerase